MNEIDLPPAPEPETKLSEPPGRPPGRRGVTLVLLIVVALLGWGAYGHWQRERAAAATQHQMMNFVPTLQFAVAKRLDGPVTVTLPGTTLAFDSARIYARSTGYIADRRVDFGSRVHKSDLLLRVDAPDLDQQLAQAAAQLVQMEAALQQAGTTVDQARANAALANVTNSRTSRLARDGWETWQNADTTRYGLTAQNAGVANAQAGVKVAEANFHAQYATVQRLKQLVDYERVTAPFDGVVTTRNVDNGDLVSADANGGTPLLTVQRDDVLRIEAYVPQSAAIGIHDGDTAQIRLPELPGQVFDGRVSRSAEALDPGSRTLLVQVDVPNPNHVLRAGLYVLIDFAVPRSSPGVVIPAEALLFNGDGLRVAAVDASNRIRMHKVSILRDFGTTLELSDGLAGGEKVALSPPADIHDGQPVQLITAQPSS